jgi:electron transfer flavoprotein alpha subunit
VDLKVDGNGVLLRYKPVFGGNAIAVIRCEETPQMVTVRPKCFEAAERNTQRGEIIDFQVEVKETKLKVMEVVKQEPVKLDKAEAIISGGRGLGDRDGFALLKELAEVLRTFKFRKVEIAGSRPAVDAGWIEKNRQVGLTGVKVSPELYVAVGISGAMQHIAGITKAKKIVAINTDPKAPIFNFADYGVVGDYKKVVPAIIRKLRESQRS